MYTAEHQLLQALFGDEYKNEGIRVSAHSDLVQFLHKSRMNFVLGPRDLVPTCIAYLEHTQVCKRLTHCRRYPLTMPGCCLGASNLHTPARNAKHTISHHASPCSSSPVTILHPLGNSGRPCLTLSQLRVDVLLYPCAAQKLQHHLRQQSQVWTTRSSEELY